MITTRPLLKPWNNTVVFYKLWPKLLALWIARIPKMRMGMAVLNLPPYWTVVQA